MAADAERQIRAGLARNRAGVLVAASPALQARRAAKGKDIACRCGRDTVEASLHPKVLQCLCCGGVTIDKVLVKEPRGSNARIVARAALPAGDRHALPVLRLAGYVRGVVNAALPAVDASNNRR
ncbi:hypothetical protein LTR12_013656 [Friedmanniomyces endolithicus]|nr:hypothetical protein LTR12_013656 [Friedmanniomyces endolithicus]